MGVTTGFAPFLFLRPSPRKPVILNILWGDGSPAIVDINGPSRAIAKSPGRTTAENTLIQGLEDQKLSRILIRDVPSPAA